MDSRMQRRYDTDHSHGHREFWRDIFAQVRADDNEVAEVEDTERKVLDALRAPEVQVFEAERTDVDIESLSFEELEALTSPEVCQ